NQSNPADTSSPESNDTIPDVDSTEVETKEPVVDEVPTIPREPASRTDWLAGTCFFLSGFLSLVYEICWIRKSSLIFGNTTYAVSTVVAVFFGGLAIGSYLFGKVTKRNLSPIKTYAKLEIGVGILAALTPLLFHLVQAPFGAVYDQWLFNYMNNLSPLSGLMLPAFRMLLITACILPTSILIGGTLPLFCRQYVRQTSTVARPVGWLYGINTLGAACGCACCGFLMIPTLGIDTSIYLAAFLNLLVGLTALQLKMPAIIPYIEPVVEEAEENAEVAPSEQQEAAEEVPAADSSDDGQQADDDDDYGDDEEYYEDEPWTLSNPSRVMAILFFMCGFTALANEVLWTRFLSLILHNTVYTYTLTLTVILLGIVLGSILTASRFDRVQRHGLLFGCVQAANAILVLLAMLLPASFWAQWTNSSDTSSQLYLIAAIMLVPSILSGMTFPLAIRFVVSEPSHAGVSVGRMVALNTLGGIIGSLLVGFIFLPNTGMALTLKWTTGVGLLAGVGSWMLLDTSTLRLWLVIGSAFCWLAIPYVMPTDLPRDYLNQDNNLVAFREGTGSTVSILRDEAYNVLEIDRLWQGTTERTHQALAAHIPAILHERPEDVLVVGLGPGQTARRFLMHGVKKLDCVEIEPSLVELLQLHGEDFQAEWLNDPAVSIIFDDGRNYITHTKTQYDIISIEIGQVFRPGLGSFYTREFYEAAKPRLRKNGILCQFIPIKFLTKEHFRSLVGTFVDAFPNSVLWYNTHELLLLGTPGDPIKLSPARLAAIELDERLHEDLAYAYWGGPDHYLNQRHVFLGGFLTGSTGLKKLSRGAPRQKDNLPLLEYMKNLNLMERDFHKPIVELIQENLTSPASILSEQLPEADIQAGTMVRDENLRSIVSSAYLEIGSTMFNQRDYLRCVPYLLRAVNYLPANAEANFFLGNAHGALNNLDLSTVYYQQAIAIRPNYVRAHTHLAFMLRRMGQTEGAIEHFERVLELTPMNIQALFGLSQIRSTHPDAAIRNAAEALQLASTAARYTQGTNPQILMALGDAFAANGQFKEAIEVAEQAIAQMRGGLQTEGIRQRIAFYRQKRPYIEQPVLPNAFPGQNPGQPAPANPNSANPEQAAPSPLTPAPSNPAPAKPPQS
ncbi:MAG: fused MFS/spermidine synthase, partial [Pirellulaceae bacterium]